jgi:hypothetical protein
MGGGRAPASGAARAKASLASVLTPATLRIALAATLGALTLWGATRPQRPLPVGRLPLGCAAKDKPGARTHALTLAKPQLNWLAGAATRPPLLLLCLGCRRTALTHRACHRAAMKTRYGLTDTGKALRVCITYAAALSEEASAALMGPAQAVQDGDARAREARSFELRQEQSEWLERAAKRCGERDVSAALRRVLDGIIDGAPEEAVFNVVRCSSTAGRA